MNRKVDNSIGKVSDFVIGGSVTEQEGDGYPFPTARGILQHSGRARKA